MQLNVARDYQKASVTTADRVRIVVMCYDGCIANASRAQEEMRRGNVAEKGVYLSKAVAIVTELLNTLDTERGGGDRRAVGDPVSIRPACVHSGQPQAGPRPDGGADPRLARVEGWLDRPC